MSGDAKAPPGAHELDRQRVTTAVLSELLGLANSTRVRQLAREGQIPHVGRNAYELGPALRGYIGSLKGGKVGAQANEAARLKRLQGDRLEREEAEAAGELLRRDQVAATMAAIINVATQALDGLPARVAVDQETSDRIREEVHKTRDQISSSLAALAEPGRELDPFVQTGREPMEGAA